MDFQQPDKCTRNAIYALKTLGELCCEVINLHCSFIDYTIAFNRLQHNISFESLSESGLTDKDLRLEQDMYVNQTAAIRVENCLSGSVLIEIHVRRRDILSTNFFCLYSEMITRNVEEGVRVDDIYLNIREVDDTVLATNEKDLQNPLNVLKSKRTAV